MNALQQKCRPKHQVLVLKCYPRTTKGAVDVKPNSSELSYLLFYASSRRSKIQKVGQFLEKKTASDVWRLRIGNVQVTLQILAALIEKSPKDLPLFAPNVLKVLGLILRSQDLTMVEASLPTFETFCEHHDAAALFADQSYLEQYKDITKVYAGFASTIISPTKTTLSKPIAMQWRSAGLGAIKSIAQSDALSSVAGRQLEITVPMVLENLWTDNEDFLQVLLQRANLEEKTDTTAPLRRRTSISTTQTSETGGDTNPVALSGSTNEIDRLAEQDVGVLAMQCLKQIFVVPNRAQVSGATRALIEFINDRLQQNEVVIKSHPHTGQDKGWAVTIFGLVARWAPVQDRYVIIITAMDVLSKTQATAENVKLQNVLLAVVGSLLRSDVNLIGLSIMDVLLGLLQLLKKVMRTRGISKTIETAETEKEDQLDTLPADHDQLLDRIQKCIGHLATHVYYGDQVTDMMSTIFSLLRANPATSEAGSSSEKDPKAGAVESMSSLSDDQQQLGLLFAHQAGKVLALKAIKSILLVANEKTKADGRTTLNRTKVPLQVWEGTHWLLRDPDGAVRKAYAEALVTWLDRETSRRDAYASDETKPRVGRRETGFGQGTRRAVSSASTRERPARVPKSHFLRLLHLAAYDNAMQFMDYDSDIVLLHIVLAKLVDKLGINAVRFGLPMVFRLQEDIQEAETPLQKVRLGCLCHGYFLAVSVKFQLENSIIGRAIQTEITRRRSKQFWTEGIQIPPSTVELAGMPGEQRAAPRRPNGNVETEALLPFDERFPLVEQLCGQYQDRPASPSLSPPSSPNRTFAQPILGSASLAIPSSSQNERDLPNYIREDMLMEWTRDATLAAVQEGSKSASLSGSKTGTASRFGASGLHPNGYAASRPASAYAQNSIRPLSHVGAGQMAALRKSSLPSPTSTRSQSPRNHVASVDQLKSVLSGEVLRPSTFSGGSTEEEDSDSVASHDLSPSEFSVDGGSETGREYSQTNGDGLSRSRSKSSTRKASGHNGGPLSSNPTAADQLDLDGVPPVPPLPAGVTGVSPVPPTLETSQYGSSSFQQQRPKTGRKSIKSRGGEGNGGFSGALGNENSGNTLDLQSLLKGIDSKSREHTIGSLTKPPY
ncbi:protein EFR3 [Microdochium nivale]|nr:protein EFR3 [Microdochium nivale]